MSSSVSLYAVRTCGINFRHLLQLSKRFLASQNNLFVTKRLICRRMFALTLLRSS